VKILFVRHAQSTANIRNALDTAAPGAPLSALGRQQAAALPAALHAEVDGQISAVYASPLRRTQETAEPLSRELGLPVQVRPGLQEVLAGDLEGRADESSILRYLANAQSWAAGDLDQRLPGGESGHEVLARMDAVVEEAARSGARVVTMVSHGCAIWTWTMSRTRNIGRDVDPPNAMSNTALVVVEGDPDHGWDVTSWEGTVLRRPELVDTEHDGPHP
jgi:broad specificity phosphatase PhoE